MRRGEILALQWQDFDPAHRMLIVRRALSHANTKVVVGSTKTGKVRTVALNDSLVTILQEHRGESAFNKPTDWICVGKDGSHLIPLSLTRYFTKLVGKLGLDCTLHGLRHTHATSLIAAGVPVKVISDRLGHANISTTMDIYGHVLPTMQRQAADIVENIWTGDCAPGAHWDGKGDMIKEPLCTYCAPALPIPTRNGLQAAA